MLHFFKIAFQGIRVPRYYAEASKLNRLQAISAFLITTLLITCLNMGRMLPLLGSISQDAYEASEHIPHYSIDQGTLSIAPESKPYYYHSDKFQLVIDDTIQSENGTIPINADQQEKLSKKPLFSLFIFKDSQFIRIDNQLQKLPQSLANVVTNADQLKDMLQSYKNNPGFYLSVIGIFLWGFSMISYGLMLFTAQLFFAIFDLGARMFWKWHQRFMILLAAAIVPILMQIVLGYFMPIINTTLVLFLLLIWQILRFRKSFWPHAIESIQNMALSPEEVDRINDDDPEFRETLHAARTNPDFVKQAHEILATLTPEEKERNRELYQIITEYERALFAREKPEMPKELSEISMFYTVVIFEQMRLEEEEKRKEEEKKKEKEKIIEENKEDDQTPQ